MNSKKLVIRISLVLFTLFIPFRSFGQTSKVSPLPGYKLIFKDGEIVQVPSSTPIPKRFPAIIDKKGRERSRREAEEYAKSHGFNDLGYEEPGENSAPPPGREAFELPSDQVIPNCQYVSGYSFPDFCFEWSEEEGNKQIFEAGKDPQSTLDAIKERYGIKGEYNVVPKGYVARPVEANETHNVME